MNRYLQEKWPWISGTHTMRPVLLDLLTDADLAFSPGGLNMTFGELCREMGDIEQSYLSSLQTFTQDWAYHLDDPAMATQIDRLKAWYQRLDTAMEATVTAFSDADLAKTIDRGGGFVVPVEVQLDIYLQALLIFFGKAAIYVKAMGKPLPGQIAEWIG